MNKTILDLLEIGENEQSITLKSKEFKNWWWGVIYEHGFYKNKKLHGEYKRWNLFGILREHYLYEKGKIIEVYLDEKIDT